MWMRSRGAPGVLQERLSSCCYTPAPGDRANVCRRCTWLPNVGGPQCADRGSVSEPSSTGILAERARRLYFKM